LALFCAGFARADFYLAVGLCPEQGQSLEVAPSTCRCPYRDLGNALAPCASTLAKPNLTIGESAMGFTDFMRIRSIVFGTLAAGSSPSFVIATLAAFARSGAVRNA
jgi:hypothetical protein